MLAVQVALGIVLAYVIISNQKKLLIAGGWLMRTMGVLIGIGLFIWAVTVTVQSSSSWLPPRFWPKLWHGVTELTGIMFIFALGATATLGMVLLFHLFRTGSSGSARVLPPALNADPDKKSRKDGSWRIMGLALLMFTINLGLSFPLWAYTPIGRWYEAVDAYGRANGWNDGLSLFFCAVLWQWFWLPVGVNYVIRRSGHSRLPMVMSATEPPSNPQPD